jgi:hypothetical protein
VDHSRHKWTTLTMYECVTGAAPAVVDGDSQPKRKIGLHRAQSLYGDGLALRSGSAATEQDLCRTVEATSQVNWATTLACVLKFQTLNHKNCNRRCSSCGRRSHSTEGFQSWRKPGSAGRHRRDGGRALRCGSSSYDWGKARTKQ